MLREDHRLHRAPAYWLWGLPCLALMSRAILASEEAPGWVVALPVAFFAAIGWSGMRVVLTPRELVVHPLGLFHLTLVDAFAWSETPSRAVRAVRPGPVPWLWRWIPIPWLRGGPCYVVGDWGSTPVRIERHGRLPITVGVRDTTAVVGVLQVWVEGNARAEGPGGIESPGVASHRAVRGSAP